MGMLFIYELGNNTGDIAFLENMSSMTMLFYGTGLVGFASFTKKIIK